MGGRPCCHCGCALMEVHCRPPTLFLFPGAPTCVVLLLRDLILYLREAGMSVAVAAQTEVLAPWGLSVGGEEVRGNREDCTGPCRGVCRKETGRKRAVQRTLSLAARLPAAPRPLQTLEPASPGVCPGSPARVDVGRRAARSSRHWLGSRLSPAAAVTLRLSELWRKQTCVEFLFDPHVGLNRKLRSPSPGPTLAFVVGSASAVVRRLPRDPCSLGRPGWGWEGAL